MSAHTTRRTVPFTPASAGIFPSTITDDISDKALALLEVDPRVTSVTKGDVFTLWQVACSLEGLNPNIYTHTFRSDNDFAIQAKQFKAVLTGTEF